MWGIWFQYLVLLTDSLMLKMIQFQILGDQKDKKIKKNNENVNLITNPLSERTQWDATSSWNPHETGPIHFQNSLEETTCVDTRNINIARLRANTSCRINLSLQSPTISYDDCRVRMHPLVRMRRIVPANCQAHHSRWRWHANGWVSNLRERDSPTTHKPKNWLMDNSLKTPKIIRPVSFP